MLMATIPVGTSAASSTEYQLNDTISFGSYPQMQITDSGLIEKLDQLNVETNGILKYGGKQYKKYFNAYFEYQPITWRVLSDENGQLLLLSEKVIDAKAYNVSNSSTTWSKSTLRTWLNSTFLEDAFSSQDKELICNKYLVNEGNPFFNISGGNSTTDKIFILSYSDVLKPDYGFESTTNTCEARKAKLTDYARFASLHSSCTLQNGWYMYNEGSIYGYYWLRTPGKNSACACTVFAGGDTNIKNYEYYGVFDDEVGVRPALYINKDNFSSEYSCLSPNIPQDAVEFQGHYYKFFTDKMKWHDAKKYCEDLGGYLVTITSAEENQFISSLIGGDIIIGATDEAQEGVWQWVTGELFEYSNFPLGEPNNQGNEDYLCMGKSGFWNDGHCEREYWAFVCEWDVEDDDNVFVSNQSSEYSYLMGESWKNAGMENINEYLMTFPSISKAVIDSYNSNQEFIKSVAGWKTLNMVFEPGQLVDDAFSLKDYYSAILISLIDSEILDENYVKSIEEASKFEYVKLYNQFSKIIISCDEIDHEKLLSNGTCSIEEITKLNNKINTLDGISSKISSIGKFLSTGKTINDSINLCITYYNICNTSKYIVNVLKGIKANSSDMFLSMAIDDIINVSENAFDYVVSGFLTGTVNAVKDYGVGKINDAWQQLLSNSNPIFKGALLGYKVGKPLSNIFLNTDKIISNYYEFTALHEIEKALKATIKDFETSFYNKVDADSSLNYINTVSMYFKAYYLSCDYATELAKYRNLCPFGYIFYNGKQSFEDANKQFSATRSNLKSYEDQLFRLWAYSLKERYPEVYLEIAPSLGEVYSTDLSTALVRLEYLTKTYTGEEMEPSVTVAMGNAVLFPEEYTVTYNNNKNPGIATVKITAAPSSLYTGEKTVEFVINEPPFTKRLSIRKTPLQTSLVKSINRKTTLQKSMPKSTNNDIELPDLFFYEDGKIVASVEHGVITNDDLPIFISENGIDILMQDKDYTVEISGSSNQIYTAEIQKLNDELQAVKKDNYNNLLLNTEVQCNIYSDENDEIIINNEVMQPDFSTDNTTNLQQYNIYSDQCIVDGLAYEKQRVYISAIIPEGNIFVGWSVSPQVLLSSNSSVSSFIMPNEDVHINAEFIVNQSYFDLKDAINEALKIEYDKHTKTSYEYLQSTIDECKSALSYDISQELCNEKIAEIQTAISTLEEIQPLSFYGASLTLQNNLKINFVANKELFEETGYETPYTVFEINGNEVTVSDYTVNGEYYVFSFSNIAPDKMNDTITATLHATYGGVEYASTDLEYSIAQYCYSMLGRETTTDKLRTLLVDLLNYGAASQIYTGYHTDDLVNSDLTGDQKDWGTAADPALTSVTNARYRTVDSPDVTWAGVSLNLSDSITMQFVFSTASTEGVTVRIENSDGTLLKEITAAELATSGNYYIAKFKGLTAGQMSDTVYVTAYRGDEAISNTVAYSVESYAYAKQNDANENLANMVKAMMKYGNSAYAYVH